MNTHKAKVFHFLIEPRVGGILKVIESVKIGAKSVDSTVVACGDGPATEIRIANIRRPFRALYFLEFVINLFLIFFRFFWAARKGNAIFHVHSNNHNAPLIIAALLRVPTIWHFHSVMDANSMGHPMVVKIFEEQRRISHVAINTLPHRIVCASEGCIPTWKLENKSPIVIDSPIDVDYWSLDAWGGDREIESNTMTMVNVANLNHLKGHDVLMEALAILDDERLKVDLIGPELAGFKAYAKALHDHPHASQCNFLGGKEKEEIRDALGRRGIFLLQSRTEACPVSLCEAMAMGCFCVATKVGSVPRFLADGRGLLCEPDDPHSLAEALSKALSMSQIERDQMAKRAREFVVENCRVDAIGAQYDELYASLLAESD